MSLRPTTIHFRASIRNGRSILRKSSQWLRREQGAYVLQCNNKSFQIYTPLSFDQQQRRRREISNSSYYLQSSNGSGNGKETGAYQHKLFEQQMEELEAERTGLLGSDDDDDDDEMINSQDLIHTGNFHQTKNNNSLSTYAYKDEESSGIDTSMSPKHNSDASTSSDFEADMQELHAERDALFQFTADEREAWGSNASNLSTSKLSPEFLAEIERARSAANMQDATTNESSSGTFGDDSSVSPTGTGMAPHHDSFSHLSKDGNSIHMVDVGHKEVTTRVAKAQSKVRLPPEVLEAFDLQSSTELVGPKGPIFATAKLAGIMAAKKTSDLIPLCHPLPLDQVQIDIFMTSQNEVTIECSCRVTHKTGVEMEALTGATVAALTIYDMTKAVSHQIEISDTKLLSKTGGKRQIGSV